MTEKKKYIKPEFQYWTAEELDQIVAQMSGGSGGTPLVVTMDCPGSTVYGSQPPTFIAKTNKPANFAFYLDNVLQPIDPSPPPPDRSASFEPNAVLPGTYTVKVIATSGSERSEATCEWTVEEPLVVTLECPGPTVYGWPQRFVATANKPASFEFDLDNDPVPHEIESDRSASFIPDVSVGVGEHEVRVVATSGGETAQATCTWTVVEPLVVTMNCPDPPVTETVGSVRLFSVTTSAASCVTISFIPASDPLRETFILRKRVVAGETIIFSIDSSNIGDLQESELLGTNTIKVTAIGSDFPVSGFATCSWTLGPLWPELFMPCPGPGPYEKKMIPAFTALTDRLAKITICVRNESGEIVLTDSGIGTLFSFIFKVSEIGTYEVCAQAENEFGLSEVICCPLVVVDPPLEINRIAPKRELVIDALINGNADHEFKAKAKGVEAKLDMSYEVLSGGPMSLDKPTIVEQTIKANAVADNLGNYRITASATAGGETVSVHWDWVVGEQRGRCSTWFFVSGEGLSIHLCEADANIIAAIGGIGDIVLIPILISAGLTGGAALGAAAILAATIAIVYWLFRNLDDGTLDIFIPIPSLNLIPEAIGQIPIPIPIMIGGISLIVWM